MFTCNRYALTLDCQQAGSRPLKLKLAHDSTVPAVAVLSSNLDSSIVPSTQVIDEERGLVNSLGDLARIVNSVFSVGPRGVVVIFETWELVVLWKTAVIYCDTANPSVYEGLRTNAFAFTEMTETFQKPCASLNLGPRRHRDGVVTPFFRGGSVSLAKWLVLRPLDISSLDIHPCRARKCLQESAPSFCSPRQTHSQANSALGSHVFQRWSARLWRLTAKAVCTCTDVWTRARHTRGPVCSREQR